MCLFIFFPANRRLVYEEMKKAVERDRSTVRVSELSKLGLMEITRKRVCIEETGLQYSLMNHIN